MREVPDHIPKPPYLGPGGPRSPEDGVPDHPFVFTELHPERIEVKTPAAIEAMRAAGALAREALEVAGKLIVPGVTSEEVDAAVHDFTVARGAYPSPLGYMGFPKAICTSANDVIAHGIPDSRVLESGDIVNVDVTVYLDGYHGDTSSMFFCGKPGKSAFQLCEGGRSATDAGIAVCGPGVDFREIGNAIYAVTQEAGLHCSALLAGHGIGTYFHGAPTIIPAVNDLNQGVMKPGMTFTVEPVVVENMDKTWEMCADGWTLRTRSGAWNAQFEHTVLITDTGHEVLTGPSVDYKAISKKARESMPEPPPEKPKQSARKGFSR